MTAAEDNLTTDVRDAAHMAWHVMDEAARLMPDERIMVRRQWLTFQECADEMWQHIKPGAR